MNHDDGDDDVLDSQMISNRKSHKMVIVSKIVEKTMVIDVIGGRRFWTFTVVGYQGGDCYQEKS